VLGEEGEFANELAGGGYEPFHILDRLLCLILRRRICECVRILQLVSPAAKVGKDAEAIAELGANSLFDRVVTTVCRRPQALL
jgi:hypothetical protein